MDLDLPANLQRTADILRNSLMSPAHEKVPAMPAGLFEDLTARFGASAAFTAPPAKISLFGKIQSFVSTPAFGMAAAALVVLTVVIPGVMEPSGDNAATGFRGGSAGSQATASASIVLIGAPQDIISSLGASGDFETGSILTADTASGPKVIVDFDRSTVISVTADGRTVHSAGLPADRAELSAAIAEALSKL